MAERDHEQDEANTISEESDRYGETERAKRRQRLAHQQR